MMDWNRPPYRKSGDLEEGGSARPLYPMMVERPELRWAFVRKIYAILSIQMLLTIAISSIVVSVKPISLFFISSGGGLGLYIFLIFLPFLVMYPLYHYYQQHPINLILLAIFTVSISFSVGLTCAFIEAARNYEHNDTKIGSIRAQMSPDQGPEALLEGSTHDSEYQTVSKFDNLIVESSSSMRRIQRSQEHRNPTSVSQKIVHRTVNDQGIQYRPSSPISSSKRTLDSKLEEIKREIEDRSCPLCSSSTTAGARHSAQGPTVYSRPDISAQGPMLSSRPDVLLKARRSAAARNFKPNYTKISSIRAQMSPDQGPEALLEGSTHDSDYQTVSKFHKLIAESSGSTRRIQRAQEHRNLTSVSQKIVHRTVNNQGIQYRPSSPISSSKITLDSKLEEIKREIEDRSCPLCSSSTTAGVPPDHRLKALLFAGPPPKGPTARHSAEGPTLCSRPNALLKALRSAQGPTLCSRPDGKVILESVILTAVVVFSLTLYTFWAAKRGHDFSFLAPFLFAAVMILLVFSIIQLFFPLGKISIMIYGGLASLIFCGYIIYDTDNLIKRYAYDEYIWAAVALYLDIINLFLSLLTLFRASDS
ncbi:hypothetical protein M5K25_004222 [Dendrobium thyrsiflorum]|uniref:BI1-like protein n=1 Tax=Dendrobium thyrsiflorum TaxID=117978 RepID=A0ABD0VTM4_DENTH